MLMTSHARAHFVLYSCLSSMMLFMTSHIIIHFMTVASSTTNGIHESSLCMQPASPDGRLPGQVHYENLCMKAVNQSIGRSIRHARDYASIVLVDQRYARSSVREKLPDWIASQLQVCQGFGQAFAAVRKVQACSYDAH